MFFSFQSLKVITTGTIALAAVLSFSTVQIDAAPAGKGKDPGLVDCAAGNTIGAALAAGVTDITVRGICSEHVQVRDSNITIRGETLDFGGAPLDGVVAPDISTYAIQAFGARNLNLVDLRIENGRAPVSANFGSGVFITNSDLVTGVESTWGMIVTDNSVASVRDTNISEKAVLAIRGAVVRLFNSTVSVTNKNSTGLALNQSDGVLAGSTIEGRVSAFMGGHLAVYENFATVTYPPSVIDTDGATEISCTGFSGIIQSPIGILDDGAGVDLNLGDISQSGCMVFNFAAAP